MLFILILFPEVIQRVIFMIVANTAISVFSLLFLPNSQSEVILTHNIQESCVTVCTLHRITHFTLVVPSVGLTYTGNGVVKAGTTLDCSIIFVPFHIQPISGVVVSSTWECYPCPHHCWLGLLVGGYNWSIWNTNIILFHKQECYISTVWVRHIWHCILSF